MSNHSPAAPQRLNAIERRHIVFEMRKTGASFRAILEALKRQHPDKVPPSYSERHVYQDIKRQLAVIHNDMALDVDAVRTMELQTLDKAQAAIFPGVVKGDAKAVESLIKIMARRASYLGLDAPVKREGALTPEAVLALVDNVVRAFNDEALASLGADADPYLHRVQARLDALAQAAPGITALLGQGQAQSEG